MRGETMPQSLELAGTGREFNAATITKVNPSDVNSGAFVSLNPSNNELWVTLNASIITATIVQIG
jgi:hypothetical protein